MDKKLALNKFNCDPNGNKQDKVLRQKYRCLPKVDYETNKKILKLIQELKKGL
jgi:hypothetical protein